MPTLTFDPEGLHRAVLNVVTNAIDACDETARRRVVTVTHRLTCRPSRWCRSSSKTTASASPPEDLDKIFTIFVSQKGSRGTGLGLPVSQKILKEHGGRILVESQLGAGSRFTLELPAVLSDVPGPHDTSSVTDAGLTEH